MLSFPYICFSENQYEILTHVYQTFGDNSKFNDSLLSKELLSPWVHIKSHLPNPYAWRGCSFTPIGEPYCQLHVI